MTTTIIIILSVLVLFSYLFEISASKTKFPSAILLLLLGFLVKIIIEKVNLQLPNLNPILPVLGTLGLILIVLEGSLELELNREKFSLIKKSFFIAGLSVFILSFSTAYILGAVHKINIKTILSNVIPLSIISSAIAVPSVKYLNKYYKEFITYESSLSDIIGVILFNFITLNDSIGTQSFGIFFLQLIAMLIISFTATIILSRLLYKIKDNVKYLPIIIMIVLIYAISKHFHLPGLIFILIFGLFLGNLDEFKNHKFINFFHTVSFNSEIAKLKEITSEITFLIRSLFFLLFGFLIEIKDIINIQSLIYSTSITLLIFTVRFVLLKRFSIRFSPTIYIAPRGLITILLFLTIPVTSQVGFIGKPVVIQVIIFTSIIMVWGMIKNKKTETPTNNS